MKTASLLHLLYMCVLAVSEMSIISASELQPGHGRELLTMRHGRHACTVGMHCTPKRKGACYGVCRMHQGKAVCKAVQCRPPRRDRKCAKAKCTGGKCYLKSKREGKRCGRACAPDERSKCVQGRCKCIANADGGGGGGGGNNDPLAGKCVTKQGLASQVLPNGAFLDLTGVTDVRYNTVEECFEVCRAFAIARDFGTTPDRSIACQSQTVAGAGEPISCTFGVATGSGGAAPGPVCVDVTATDDATDQVLICGVDFTASVCQAQQE